MRHENNYDAVEVNHKNLKTSILKYNRRLLLIKRKMKDCRH